MGRPVADIGSNDEKFWVWVRSPEKAIYVGKYNANGTMPPGLLFEPDWVIEAMGLRLIPDDEMAEITVENGERGTLVLTHRRLGPNGDPTIKRTVVNRATGTVLQHIFYAADGKTILARAEVKSYQQVPLLTSGSSDQNVMLPRQIVMTATPPGQESLKLKIALNDPTVNPTFDEQKREIVFTVPEMDGYKVVNVNEQLGPTANQPEDDLGSTTYHHTRPSPPAGDLQVELEEPVPVGYDESSARPVSDEPSPLSADLPPGGISTVVGAPVPRPPGYESIATADPFRGVEFAPSLRKN